MYKKTNENRGLYNNKKKHWQHIINLTNEKIIGVLEELLKGKKRWQNKEREEKESRKKKLKKRSKEEGGMRGIKIRTRK